MIAAFANAVKDAFPIPLIPACEFTKVDL